jgi:hypothetical protein
MAEARSSKRDRLSPVEISEIICKAHGIFDPADPLARNRFDQLDVGPIWHGVALDLMLANVDQKLWGWADTLSLYLLDYWCDLDPRMAFVLVYDSPATCLENIEPTSNLTAEEVGARLDNWVGYNESMLRFFLRHQDRCLLVNAQQVRYAVQSYLDQLQARLDVTLPEPSAHVLADMDEEGGAPIDEAQPVANVEDDVAQALVEVGETDIAVVHPPRRAQSFLLDHVIKAHRDCTRLYKELQSAADMPFADGDDADDETDSNNRALAEWLRVSSERAAHATQVALLTAQQEELSLRLNEREAFIDTQNEAFARELDQRDDDIARFEAELRRARRASDEHKRALVETRASVEKLEKKIAEARSAPRSEDPLAASKNNLLVAQVRQMQAELETVKARAELAKAAAEPAKPIRRGAADRVKDDLPYRLGNIVVKRRASLSLPWLISKEAREYWKARASSVGLPPLSEYSDLHDAERVKQHLSYRLGQILVEQGNHPLAWLKLPFALGREALRFTKERKSKEKN